MSHNNNFNFLRIFAAILVCITHSYAITGHALNEPLHQLTQGHFYFSSLGLYIFFFTSGYLVTRSAATTKSPIFYLQKRALRIYPALLIVVIISVFIAGPFLSSYHVSKYFSATETWKYLWTASGLKIRFSLPGVFEDPRFAMKGFNGSLWSIKLELEMYALLFLLMISGVMKSKKILIIIFVTLIIAFIFLNDLGQYSILMPDHKNLLLAVTFLFGGIMQTNFISKKISVYLLTVSGLLLLAKITGIIKVDIMLDEVIFFSLATYFIAFSNWFTIKIKNDISYGVYIYTFPLQQFFFQLFAFSQSPLVNFLLSLCCSGLLAFLSWIYIEKPALKFKSKLA
ncbi:MAG: acyltransferase [Bacteroidota bacterium]|nr:acyltransferase [Bacteroidota bacterium]